MSREVDGTRLSVSQFFEYFGRDLNNLYRSSMIRNLWPAETWRPIIRSLDYRKPIFFSSNVNNNILEPKGDWNFWISDLVKNPDGTDI